MSHPTPDPDNPQPEDSLKRCPHCWRTQPTENRTCPWCNHLFFMRYSSLPKPTGQAAGRLRLVLFAAAVLLLLFLLIR